MSDTVLRTPNSIRYLREKRGLKLADLERLTGIPNGQISRMELYGYGLGPANRRKLADALGVPEWQFYVPEKELEKILLLP